VIYAVLRAIIDSFVEWASKPREVRLVGGGKRLADRVRAAISARTRQPDADHRGDRPRPGGRA
jgi:hypothetical protein